MKGLGVGIVIGFALGAVTVWLAGGGLTVSAPNATPDPGASDTPGRTPLLPGPGENVRRPARDPGAEPPPQPAADEEGSISDALAELDALSRRARERPGSEVADQLAVVAQAIRSLPAGKVRVPWEILSRMLAGGDRRLSLIALSLADLSDPPLGASLAEFAGDDPDADHRAMAVIACVKLGWSQPELAEAVLAAARDPHPHVRATAVAYIGQALYQHLDRAPPGFAGAVLAATRDPEAEVREAAIYRLDALGRAGAVRAVELIEEGVDDDGLLDALAEAAVTGGMAVEALGADPPPELVTPIIYYLDWEDPAAVGALRGRYEELLPRFQPSEPDEFEDFFLCALLAGDSELVIMTVNDGRRREPARLHALLALLESTAHVEAGLAALRTLLWDPDAAASLQRDAIDGAQWSSALEGPVLSAFQRLLEDARASHPSVWVREEAEEALDVLKDLHLEAD